MINSDNNKIVFVIGPESSGSQLIAKIIAHVLNVRKYTDWKGGGWAIAQTENFDNNVVHRSLPDGGLETLYPDIDEWVNKYNNKEIYFVLTTRDQNIVALSKKRRFNRTNKDCEMNRKKSREILEYVIANFRYFIWSYETFLYLQESYLKILYNFLGEDSDFHIELYDGNKKYIRKRPPRKKKRLLKRAVRKFSRLLKKFSII